MNIGFDENHVATSFWLSFLKRKNKGNDSYSRKCSAYSMVEVLVTLVVLGVIAIILVPVLRGTQPDDIDTMHKKATAIIQRITNELSSDNYLYPRSSKSEGFTNTSAVTVDGVTHQGDTKFCTLFVSRLVLKPGTEANCTAGALTATTAEGIEWYLPISDFKNGAQVLMIDANGPEEPNAVGEDRFEYYIQAGFTSAGYENTIVTSESELPPELAKGADFSNLKAPDPRETLKTYKIEVKNKPAVGLQAVIGEGPNKVNGQYVLNAIPEPGYKCSWFTKHVTIEDNNVIIDDLTCEPNMEIPSGKVADVQHPEPPEGFGTIRVTSEADYTHCPPGTPFDIIQTTILANGAGGSYSSTLTANIGASVDIENVAEGSYALGYTGFDPTMSHGCSDSNSSTECYAPIKSVKFKPSTVSVYPDKVSDVTIVYGCFPEQNKKSIEIEIQDLIAFYPGANTTDTKPEVKLQGGTILVKTWQDVDITGLYVNTSEDDMRWTIVSDFDGGWGLAPASAMGDTPLKLTVSDGHVGSGCFYAQSLDDSELKSNTVCFSNEENKGDAEIKITCVTPEPNTVHRCSWSFTGPTSASGNITPSKREVIRTIKPGTYTLVSSPSGGNIRLSTGSVQRVKQTQVSEPSFVIKAGETKHIIITLLY